MLQNQESYCVNLDSGLEGFFNHTNDLILRLLLSCVARAAELLSQSLQSDREAILSMLARNGTAQRGRVKGSYVETL